MNSAVRNYTQNHPLTPEQLTWLAQQMRVATPWVFDDGGNAWAFLVFPVNGQLRLFPLARISAALPNINVWTYWKTPAGELVQTSNATLIENTSIENRMEAVAPFFEAQKIVPLSPEHLNHIPLSFESVVGIPVQPPPQPC